MNCAEFWNHEEHRGNRPEEARHLAECPACAARVEREAALSAGLRLVAAELRHMEAPSRVEMGLTAAFRAQSAYGRRRASRSRSWIVPVMVWASAAAATVALAVVLVHGWQPVGPAPVPSASPIRNAQPTLEYAADPGDDSFTLDSDFIPVPNAARIQPNEDVNFVRVQVSRSAILALGIAVSGENTSETVLADVVLGADGMARAVRVVNEGSDLE